MKESKYQPLQDHLNSLKYSRWDASFAELEQLLGFKLPKSAYCYSAWWGNHVQNSRHTKSWIEAGWKTENVNPTGQKVTFVREK